MAFKVDLNIERLEDCDVCENGFFIDSSTKEYESKKKQKNVILVTMTIDPSYEPKNYQQIYYKLQEDIRHEIEHFTQEGPYRIGDRPTLPKDLKTAEMKSVYQHHLEPAEMDALVAGFYRRAKLERKPLDVVIKDDLDTEVRRGELNKKQSKDLFYKLVDHSKKKFPRARFILPPKISPQNDPNA